MWTLIIYVISFIKLFTQTKRTCAWLTITHDNYLPNILTISAQPMAFTLLQ